MKAIEIPDGSVCYTIGAFVRWTGSKWELVSINEDIYYDGHYVNSPGEDGNGVFHYKPFIEVEEEINEDQHV